MFEVVPKIWVLVWLVDIVVWDDDVLEGIWIIPAEIGLGNETYFSPNLVGVGYAQG